MKSKIISLLLALVFTGSLSAQLIEVKPGWQLLGATENISSLSSFTTDCVDAVWTYDNDNWSTYVGSATTNTLSSISKGKGFWAKMKTCTKTEIDTNSTASSNTSPVVLDSSTRSISKYVVQMGNAYDDIGSGASGAVTGVNSVTSSSSFVRKATRSDLGQFKYNTGGNWTGALGQTIMGVDPTVSMQFIRSSTGAVIAEDITQPSSYIDMTTGALGPLADLASGMLPDLKKMNIKISVDLGSSPLTVSGSSVVMQQLVATIPMTTGTMPDAITFTTTGVLTVTDGTTLDMKNVKINVNPSEPTKLNGTYDFTKTHEGEEYSGTASFDQTGCLGADVYKAGQKVGVVKIINGEFRLQGPNGEFDEVLAL